MRIGRFCEKFQVSEDTVRYYIREGILIPELHNKQYHFDASAEADMEMIRSLKANRFTLKEIHRIMSLYRLSKFAAKEDREQLEQIYLEKQRELADRLKQTETSIACLRKLQAEYKAVNTDEDRSIF